MPVVRFATGEERGCEVQTEAPNVDVRPIARGIDETKAGAMASAAS